MNILWVSHFLLYPESGFGALQRSRILLKEMCRRHNVFLLSYDKTVGIGSGIDVEQARDDLERFCKKVILVPYPYKSGLRKNVRLAIQSVLGCKPYSISLYDSKMLVRRATEAIEAFNIDLVHADTMGLTDSIAGTGRVRWVLNHHNNESDMLRRRAKIETNLVEKGLLLVEAWMMKRYEVEYCRKYDLNLCVSELDRLRLLRDCEDTRAVVIENPVDCDFYKFEEHHCTSRRLVFSGSLDWYPNADAMIYFCEDCWSYLKKGIPDLELAIIGKNPPKRLEKAVERCKDVRLLGFVDDIRPHVKAAAAYVCPIRDGGGTRLKLLDALSQGIPIVATRVAVEGIDLTEGENILIANDKFEFLAKLNTLFSDDDLYRRISMYGRTFVERKYAGDRIGRKMIEVYEKVVAG